MFINFLSIIIQYNYFYLRFIDIKYDNKRITIEIMIYRIYNYIYFIFNFFNFQFIIPLKYWKGGDKI